MQNISVKIFLDKPKQPPYTPPVEKQYLIKKKYQKKWRRGRWCARFFAGRRAVLAYGHREGAPRGPESLGFYQYGDPTKPREKLSAGRRSLWVVNQPN
jgi:hypothetical protein